MRKALYESDADRIADGYGYDRHSGGRCLSCLRCRGAIYRNSIHR